MTHAFLEAVAADAGDPRRPVAEDTPSGTPAIGWYPGHMATAMRRLREDMRAIDVVIEVADARLPRAGTNPALRRIAAERPRVLVLSRAQLAEVTLTQAWIAYYATQHRHAIAVDAKDRGGIVRLQNALAALAAGRKTVRAIVLGIPNAGKSTLINALAGRNVARAEDRAGVTRARQWFRVGPLEIMDTAGVLVPKIASRDEQWKLALIGAVPRARFDAEDVALHFGRWYAQTYGSGAVPDLATFAQSRGFIRRGKMADMHNAAWAYLAAWSQGAFGPMTLEAPQP
ncbi:MAG: ribosome biogenesis GTPase YlqF [Candidatus Eremiobacteraeota bacterium]|nr:ribosome biogenesis GTPase YlqF [Candidatus Eremiobacteraeota bacterium]